MNEWGALVLVIVCWELAKAGVRILTDCISKSIPFMCENCGHTFTDDEDPSQRCPVCNSY